MHRDLVNTHLAVVTERSVKADPNRLMPERAAALRLARRLGCEGAHEADGGWAPCPTPEALAMTIQHGTKGYQRWKASATDSAPESRLAPQIKCWDNAQMRLAAVGEQRAVAAEYDEVDPMRFTRRQAAVIYGLRSVAEKFGKFDQSMGANGAHYMDRSP